MCTFAISFLAAMLGSENVPEQAQLWNMSAKFGIPESTVHFFSEWNFYSKEGI